MDQDLFDGALHDIAEWLDDHRDELAGAGLAPGAADDAIAAAEAVAGTFPRALKALYQRHDGQRPGHVAITPIGYLANLQLALAQLPQLLLLYVDGEAPAAVLRDDELTRAWWPLVVGEGQYFAVHLGTERVFELLRDDPAITWVADSVTEWLGWLASKLWDDEIVVSDGGVIYAA